MVYVSPNTVRVLGVALGKLIASGPIEGWVHPEDLDLVKATSGRRAGGALDSESIAFRLRRPDGTYR